MMSDRLVEGRDQLDRAMMALMEQICPFVEYGTSTGWLPVSAMDQCTGGDLAADLGHGHVGYSRIHCPPVIRLPFSEMALME